jgi:ABC-type lipoprotein export system ATPase subunit
MADPAAVEAVRLGRVYPGVVGGAPVQGLTDVSLTVGRGEVVAVTGPSGSGKTTLLYLLAGLDRPDAGSVRLAGVDWASLRGRARARFRRRTCGVIAQGMALLPQATAAENVEAPLLLDGTDPAARARRVGDALDRVGLTAHAAKLPDQLSGGQQQRVAIARALVTEPAVVLADEPTATLDSENARLIAGLLVDSARARSSAVVLVTHDAAVAAHADRIVRLHSGHLHSGGPA